MPTDPKCGGRGVTYSCTGTKKVCKLAARKDQSHCRECHGVSSCLSVVVGEEEQNPSRGCWAAGKPALSRARFWFPSSETMWHREGQQS